ncbi:hypothetical protein D3C72_1757620 [compost metagenome]
MRITAPEAVCRSRCWAMVTNITMGAPPGTITKGRRAPNFHGPNDCSKVPTPHSRKVALIRLTVSADSSPSALATRNTEVIGTAAITSTCCRPNSSSCDRGSTASTGAMAEGAPTGTTGGTAEASGTRDIMESLNRDRTQIDLGALAKKAAEAGEVHSVAWRPKTIWELNHRFSKRSTG